MWQLYEKDNSKILIVPQIMYNFGESHFFMKTLSLKSIGVIIATLLISTGAFAQEISVNGTTVLRSSSNTSQKEAATKTAAGHVTCEGTPVHSTEVKEQPVVNVEMKEAPPTYGIPEGKTLPPNANIVRGTVTENGEPIIGAYVWVKGTKIGVSTNVMGKFEIAVPKGKKLRFSMIGFKTVEVRVKGRDSINVELEVVPVYLD